MAKPKRPRDPNQLAHLIIQIATGETQDAALDEGKDPAAIVRGRLGGLKGGKGRLKALSPGRRQEIAKKAARIRWSKK